MMKRCRNVTSFSLGLGTHLLRSAGTASVTEFDYCLTMLGVSLRIIRGDKKKGPKFSVLKLGLLVPC
jgi:hypothetical protein